MEACEHNEFLWFAKQYKCWQPDAHRLYLAIGAVCPCCPKPASGQPWYIECTGQVLIYTKSGWKEIHNDKEESQKNLY